MHSYMSYCPLLLPRQYAMHYVKRARLPFIQTRHLLHAPILLSPAPASQRY